MTKPLRLFPEIFKATFKSRPNRFLVRCALERKRIDAFLPNPGRLQELLLPDATLHLTKECRPSSRKTSYTVVAVERDDIPIMLHTHRTNAVARYLIDEGRIPGLEGARVVRTEVPMGHSRFDFLVADGAGEMVVEVKSCTLVGKEVAMFPDAITDRGTRHLKELSNLARQGRRAAVLFVVHWPFARFFMPDYHTDLHFAQTLIEVRPYIDIIPVGVRWETDLSLGSDVRALEIPWQYIATEAKDTGSYLLMLHLKEGRQMDVGRLGPIFFREGFYVYVGSAMANLTARVERHKRLRKLHHWHIDTLREAAELRGALVIRSSARLECAIAKAVSQIAGWSVPGFGSSDCSCETHLFGFHEDPVHSAVFQTVLQFFRMDRKTP
ncbi:MAG: Sugar fermentation stimulation protein A [Syntrophorhabdus sp. PtaU1.Bin153]|nr:MAG: Sugar fermentation stimulation protein A [Syntrophorhabdus sp. PtaU1.Bin153]